MKSVFVAEVWYWRGPSPYHFVTVPPADSSNIKEISAGVTYGWGMIPVVATVGSTTWRTSLFPKDGNYILPLKDSVRRAESVELGDYLPVSIRVETARSRP